MRTSIRRRGRQPDGGFSIVELIIAMFLMAVIALALLPLLVGVTRSSTTNKALVAATSLANAQVAAIRAQFPNDATNTSCASLAQAVARLKTTTPDPSLTLSAPQPLATAIPGPDASGLIAEVRTSTCPTDLPGTVALTVRVHDDSGHTVVTLPTLIVVNQP